ncbi:MAG: DNA-binding response regulator [Nitrospirae bacterium]|nr:DNA-binding response regulator [Nitrospirota bacterium]
MKKILIIDEKVFSRICSAILELDGLITEIFDGNTKTLSITKNNKIGLIIMSYPFSHLFLEEIRKINIPTIILADQINKDIINLLEGLTTSYCMIKPIDYNKFKYLAKKIITCSIHNIKGYNIL